MNEPDPARTLLGELQAGLRALAKLESFLLAYERDSLRTGRRGTEQALALTQALGNYYTCLETSFFRISQLFENDLPSTHWHQALLEKMAMEIPEVRPAVIGQTTYQALLELLRFRHFSRYYYAIDCDWEKLDYLLAKFKQVAQPVRQQVDAFAKILEGLGRDGSRR